MLNIKCAHTEMVREPVGDGTVTHTHECGKPAEMVILYETIAYHPSPIAGPDGLDGGHEEEVNMFYGACADHAPEAAHEAMASMNADEYRIVVLNKLEED